MGGSKNVPDFNLSSHSAGGNTSGSSGSAFDLQGSPAVILGGGVMVWERRPPRKEFGVQTQQGGSTGEMGKAAMRH